MHASTMCSAVDPTCTAAALDTPARLLEQSVQSPPCSAHNLTLSLLPHDNHPLPTCPAKPSMAIMARRPFRSSLVFQTLRSSALLVPKPSGLKKGPPG